MGRRGPKISEERSGSMGGLRNEFWVCCRRGDKRDCGIARSNMIKGMRDEEQLSSEWHLHRTLHGK